jgi:hypothetical protein
MHSEIRNFAIKRGMGEWGNLASESTGMEWSEMKIVLYCTTELSVVVCWCLAICHIQSMTAVYNATVKYDVIGCTFNAITTNTVIAFPTHGSVLILSVCTYNRLVLKKTRVQLWL